MPITSTGQEKYKRLSKVIQSNEQNQADVLAKAYAYQESFQKDLKEAKTKHLKKKPPVSPKEKAKKDAEKKELAAKKRRLPKRKTTEEETE